MGDLLDVFGSGGTPVWVQTLASWLMTYGIHSTLFLGSAWVLSRLHRFQAPAVQDVLWKVALVGGAITASLHVGTAFEPIAGTWQVGTDDTVLVVEPEQASSVIVPPEVLPAFAADKAVFIHADGRVEMNEPLQALPEGIPFPFQEASANGWLYGLLVVWGIGVVFLGWRHGRAHQQFRQSLRGRQEVDAQDMIALVSQWRERLPRTRPIRLTASDQIASPLALASGEICVPQRVVTDLDEQQQQTMFAHELAHVIRRDAWWRVAQVVVETVFFFQPLNRVASRKMREAAEFLCDDWAVHHTGAPRSLATCIHTVASWGQASSSQVWAVGMAERHSPFLQRIHRLLQHAHTSPDSQAIQPKRWLWGAALLWFGLVAWGSPDVQYQEASGGLQWYSDPNAPTESITLPEQWTPASNDSALP